MNEIITLTLKGTIPIYLLFGGFAFIVRFRNKGVMEQDLRSFLVDQVLIFASLFLIGLISIGDESDLMWIETSHGGYYVEDFNDEDYLLP